MSNQSKSKKIRVRIVKEQFECLQLEDDRPTCSSREDGKGHNRFHNAKGQFSTKSDAASTSIRSPKSKPCKFAGQARMPGEKITRIKCGRANPKTPNIKAPYRCKDGSKVSESTDDAYVGLLDEPVIPDELQRLSKGMMERLSTNSSSVENVGWRTKYQQFINSLTRDEQREVKQVVCSYDPITMAKIINQFAKALDGKLDEPMK